MTKAVVWKDVHTKRPATPWEIDPKANRDQNNAWKYRCGVCGFAGVDARRDAIGQRDGYVVEQDSTDAYVQTTTSGCPQCGSRNWK